MVLFQGCMMLYVTIKECKRKTNCQANHACGGKTDVTVLDSQTNQASKSKTDVTVPDCPASQTGNFGDYVGPSKPFIVSVYNENTDVFVESGPI